MEKQESRTSPFFPFPNNLNQLKLNQLQNLRKKRELKTISSTLKNKKRYVPKRIATNFN